MSRFFDARNNVVCANLRNIFLNLQKEFHATFKLIIVPIMHQRSLLSDIVAFISKPYNITIHGIFNGIFFSICQNKFIWHKYKILVIFRTTVWRLTYRRFIIQYHCLLFGWNLSVCPTNTFYYLVSKCHLINVFKNGVAIFIQVNLSQYHKYITWTITTNCTCVGITRTLLWISYCCVWCC